MATSLTHKPHREPHAVDEHASKAGLRAVALFEAGKGVLVLVLAGIIIAVHNHIEDYAEDLLYHLHIDFDHRFGRALLHAASKVGDARMWTVAGAAALYAAVRFVEAWGLWHRRVWAEWFALLSGTLYLPFEILKVAERASWERIGVLAVNVVIVLYMLEIRIREARCKEEEKQLAPGQP
jgi:uncharacterized membrane protein (DUF2068 family)